MVDANKDRTPAAAFGHLMRRYMLPHWPYLAAALGLSLLLLVLDLAGLALYVPLVKTVVGQVPGISDTSIGLGGPGGRLGGFDVSAWVNRLAALSSGWERQLGTVTYFIIIASVFMLAKIAWAGVDVAGQYLLWRIRCRVATDMTSDLYGHLLRLKVGFLNGSDVGGLQSRVSENAFGLGSAMYDMLYVLFSSSHLSLVYWLILARISPGLTGIVILTAGISAVISRSAGKKMGRETAASFDALARAGSKLVSGLSGILAVKAYGREDWEHQEYSDIRAQNLSHVVKAGILKRALPRVQFVLNNLTLAVILLAGLIMLKGGTITPVMLLSYLVVLQRVQEPTVRLTSFFGGWQDALGQAGRILSLWAEKPETSRAEDPLPRIKEAVRFEGVSFSYDGRSPVLDNIDLTIETGQTVALVGPSGAGKTTMAYLLLRFYEPTAGRITADGRDVRDFALSEWRRFFGVVNQDPILFNRTVRENIAYSLPPGRAGRDEVEAAAKAANAHQFIAGWPGGYETEIGDRGMRTSGGQRQRLAIARAILRRPEILVLDEATNSLDSVSERVVQKTLDELMSRSTAFVIAHRLSTVIGADKIVVLDRGRIVDQGRHAELMERCGLYRHMCQLQFVLDSRPEEAGETAG